MCSRESQVCPPFFQRRLLLFWQRSEGQCRVLWSAYGLPPGSPWPCLQPSWGAWEGVKKGPAMQLPTFQRPPTSLADALPLGLGA